MAHMVGTGSEPRFPLFPQQRALNLCSLVARWHYAVISSAARRLAIMEVRSR